MPPVMLSKERHLLRRPAALRPDSKRNIGSLRSGKLSRQSRSLFGLTKQNAYNTSLSFQSQLQTYRLSNLRNIRTSRLLRSLKRNPPPTFCPLRRSERKMFFGPPSKHRSDTRNPQLRSLLHRPLKMIELEYRQQQMQGQRSISLQFFMQREAHFPV